MIEVIQEHIAVAKSSEEKVKRCREFLQVLMLKIMFDKEYLSLLAFTGGTALRILHGMKRYSEAMDFSLVNKKGYDFTEIRNGLVEELKKSNLKAEATRTRTAGAVHSCFIKFPNLIGLLGIAGFTRPNLLVKIEIDSHPPSGGTVVVAPVTERFVIAVNTFDLPSLFSTKLHACLFRKYTKGRDYYDLVWYLGKRVVPNFKLLNNAIRQTEKKEYNLDEANYKQFIAQKVAQLDFKKVREDVERFLEDKNELKLLDRDMILGMLN
ncbi:MAG: nucleotidyl transferase AbiEii/AbiGii toxin family protein [Chitinivibrionales bacterium]|nr:nucleotidyl transferase AbiEii/AbiGii toxin family protein [Chitinivibrionales bacterium]